MDASASGSPGGAGNAGPTASRLLYASALILLEPTRISLRTVGLMQVLLAVLTLPAFNFFSNLTALCCGAVLLRNFANKRVMENFVDADAGADAVAGEPPGSTRPFLPGARAPSLPEGAAVQLDARGKPPSRAGCCCKAGHANTLAVLTIFFGCFEIAGYAVAMWQVSGSMPQLLIYNLVEPLPANTAGSPILWKYMNLALLIGTIAPILHVTLALVATTTYDSFRNATIEVRAQQAAATVLDARLVRTLGTKKSSKWASLTKTALLDKGLTTPRSILAAVQAVAAEELSSAGGRGEDPEKAVSRILETVAAQRRADERHGDAAHPAVPPTPSGKTSFASLLAAAKTQQRGGTAALPRGRSMVPGGGGDPTASFMIPPTPLASANRARNGFDEGGPGLGGRRGSLVGRRGSVTAPRRDSGASATGAAATGASTRAGSFYDGGSSTGGGTTTAATGRTRTSMSSGTGGSGAATAAAAAVAAGERATPTAPSPVGSTHSGYGKGPPPPQLTTQRGAPAAVTQRRPSINASSPPDVPMMQPVPQRRRSSFAAATMPAQTVQTTRAGPLHDATLMAAPDEMPYDLYDMVAVDTTRASSEEEDGPPAASLHNSPARSAPHLSAMRDGGTGSAAPVPALALHAATTTHTLHHAATSIPMRTPKPGIQTAVAQRSFVGVSTFSPSSQTVPRHGSDEMRVGGASPTKSSLTSAPSFTLPSTASRSDATAERTTGSVAAAAARALVSTPSWLVQVPAQHKMHQQR